MLRITIYKITGKQLLITVPQSYCEECDLSVEVAKKAAINMREKGINVAVVVKPWVNNIIPALLNGVWHPPGVLVQGKLVSQGIVPRQSDIEKAILRAEHGR
jgi:hypothetical protein